MMPWPCLLHDLAKALMQLGVPVAELLEVQHHSGLIFLRINQVIISLCLVLRLVDEILALGLDGIISFFQECFIRLRGILLGTDGLGWVRLVFVVAVDAYWLLITTIAFVLESFPSHLIL